MSFSIRLVSSSLITYVGRRAHEATLSSWHFQFGHSLSQSSSSDLFTFFQHLPSNQKSSSFQIFFPCLHRRSQCTDLSQHTISIGQGEPTTRLVWSGPPAWPIISLTGSTVYLLVRQRANLPQSDKMRGGGGLFTCHISICLFYSNLGDFCPRLSVCLSVCHNNPSYLGIVATKHFQALLWALFSSFDQDFL